MDTATNAYKAAEKRYRRACLGDAVLAEAIDFCSPANSDGVRRETVAPGAPAWLQSAEVYSVAGVDGFRFVSHALPAAVQLDLAEAALRDWAEPPSATNLALHTDGPCCGLWDAHGRQPRGSLFSRLSWATLGYQYQWTTRQYDPAHRSPLPAELSRLASELAAACGSAGAC